MHHTIGLNNISFISNQNAIVGFLCVDDPIPPTNPRLTKSRCAHYIGVDSLEQFITIAVNIHI